MILMLEMLSQRWSFGKCSSSNGWLTCLFSYRCIIDPNCDLRNIGLASNTSDAVHLLSVNVVENDWASIFLTSQSKTTSAGLHCGSNVSQAEVCLLCGCTHTEASLGLGKRAIATTTSSLILPVVSGYDTGVVTWRKHLLFPSHFSTLIWRLWVRIPRAFVLDSDHNLPNNIIWNLLFAKTGLVMVRVNAARKFPGISRPSKSKWD